MTIIDIYVFLLILAIFVWLTYKNGDLKTGEALVSVVIVVRNESENIGKLLESIRKQTYQNFEVIIVDDQSEDNTVEIIESFGLPGLTLLRLEEKERQGTPKKSGIEKAIRLAKGEIIFSTDGDCVLPPRIIEIYAGMFRKERVKFIFGPVTFFKKNTLWSHLQTVEFASLIGSAGVAMIIGRPIMSSAANLAYRRKVFQEVDGFSGNNPRASGDDEFLMNKIFRKYPDGLIFAKNRECMVETTASETVRQFYYQRKRWAGKWNAFINFVSIMMAVFIFLVNAFTVYLLVKADWQVLFLRWIPEAVFLAVILGFLRRWKSILFIPLTQIIYPFYVVFFGLISIKRSTYQWKGRDLS